MFMSRKALDAVALLLACIPLSLYSSLVTYSGLHMLNLLSAYFFLFFFSFFSEDLVAKAAVFVGAAGPSIFLELLLSFFFRER